MSNNNLSIANAILQIKNDVSEIRNNVAEIKQEVLNLKSRFDHQFAPVVTRSDIDEIGRRITEEHAPDRIYKAVNRAQVTEYLDKLGARVIPTTLVPSVNKKSAPLTQKYDALLQFLHSIRHGANAEPLAKDELMDKRRELKKMARTIKVSTIDEDYPNPEKEWGSLSKKDQEYYQGLLEMESHKNGFDLYLCRNMWGARNLLQEACKASRRSEKMRREEVGKRTMTESQGDEALSFDAFIDEDAFEEGADSPIIEDIFSCADMTTASEPPNKRQRRARLDL